MASIKERFENWKKRKTGQKIGDIVFWLFLIMMIIPGPRKFIATNVNKVALHLRKPSLARAANAYKLSPDEYNWNIRDASGQMLDPESLKGEVVFLNFWGTFCPPCIAEMPEIQGIYNDYKDKVKFILVANEDPAKVRNFLQSRNYDLPDYYLTGSMPSALSSPSIPTTYIISRDGSVVTKKVGSADWDSKATRKVFDELLSAGFPVVQDGQ